MSLVCGCQLTCPFCQCFYWSAASLPYTCCFPFEDFVLQLSGCFLSLCGDLCPSYFSVMDKAVCSMVIFLVAAELAPLDPNTLLNTCFQIELLFPTDSFWLPTLVNIRWGWRWHLSGIFMFGSCALILLISVCFQGFKRPLQFFNSSYIFIKKYYTLSKLQNNFYIKHTKYIIRLCNTWVHKGSQG